MARKRGIRVEIPGSGRLEIDTLVTDYTGTLSAGGKLSPGVRERLRRLEDRVDIHVLTSDTFHTVRTELAGLPVEIQILEKENHHRQKEAYVTTRCDPARVAALGNGNNDRLMLQAVHQAGGLAIAVDNGEGCAVATLLNATVFIHGAAAALDVLLEPDRLKADLRV